MYTNLFHQSPVFTSHTWYTGVQTLIKNHTILSIKRITYPDFKVLGSDLIINSYMLNRAVIKKNGVWNWRYDDQQLPVHLKQINRITCKIIQNQKLTEECSIQGT